MKKLFVLAAIATLSAGHTTCSLIGDKVIWQAPRVDNFSDLPLLTVANTVALQQGFKRALSGRRTAPVVVGEDNHCDVRQIGFLSDPETLGIAAESGIKRILVEFPPSYQKKFDRIADGRQDHLVEAENSVTRCNASTDKQQDAAYTALIKNAQEKHIKIRAGDANNNAWMKLVLRNALAMAIEGQLISTINKSAGEKWDALGFKWLFQVRSDETKVVQLVKDEGVPEETLIYRGNGHITSGAPHSLRSFFPDALALSFNSSLSAWDQMYLQVECRAGGALIGDDGYPVRASNYLLNLGSATVDKCYPNP